MRTCDSCPDPMECRGYDSCAKTEIAKAEKGKTMPDKSLVERLHKVLQLIAHMASHTGQMWVEKGRLHEANATIAEVSCELERLQGMGWVSVKDRLPEEKEFFIVIDGKKNIRVALFCQGMWIGPVSESDPVTHYMPLPQPPESP